MVRTGVIHGASETCQVMSREGGSGTGCRNCLKRLISRIFLRLFLALTVPAGSEVPRKYDPLLLRVNVTFLPVMCVPEAPEA